MDFGKMAAIELARRGHFVYATTQYEEESIELTKLAKKDNLPLESFVLDIRLEEDRNKIIPLEFDVLINNAAIGDSGSVCEIRIDRIENVFETNVFSNLKLTEIALKKMIAAKYGRVIFLSSLAGRITMPFLSPYCASKFAIEAFASSLRKEVKELKDVNIEVGIIEPGAYATGFNKENNDKKYTWMQEESYFAPQLETLRKKEEKRWNFLEGKRFSSIIHQYVRAVEDTYLKHRYTAPKWQAFFTQLGRICGL